MMNATKWAYEVFREADLGDSRRTDRLARIVSQIAESPETSLSKLMGNPSENKGAQRFFGDDCFEYEDIIEPVVEATVSQLSDHERVLLIQDTSHLNYDSHLSTKGLGHIGSTKDRSFQGIMMHWTMALDGKAEPIGLASLKLWERAKDPRKKSINAHQNKPIDKKESYKWIEAFASINDQIPSHVQVICISDRESDIYEYIDTVCEAKRDFVIRSNNDRVILEKEGLLKKRVKSAEVLGTQEIEIIDSKGSKKKVNAEIRSCAVSLEAQRRKGGAKTNATCSDHKINVVRVYSKGPNHHTEWILLTTLPVISLENCLEVIWLYKQRWHIESIHKTLKSGFQAEKARLDTSEKLEKLIAMLLPCAVRIYWMVHKQKYDPDKLANQLLTSVEIRILSVKNKKGRNYVPTIKEAWLWIGWMGGFRGSKKSAPPGQITFWRGLTKLQDMAAGAEMAAAWN